MREPVQGGVALVTGAGGGLGRAIAQRLARDGWAVAVNDLRSEPAEETVSAIRAGGGRAAAFPADVTDSDAVEAMVGAIGAELGPVLVSVANASGPQPVVGLDELAWDQVLTHLEFFVKSPLLLAKAVVPGMRAAGGGRLIHIGSDLFDRADPGWSGYMAAKGALVGLTRGWATELGRDKITVNLVAPGWIPVERHGTLADEVADGWFARQDVQRWGAPADIANTVAFLASAEAGFITGQRVNVNGGFHYL
ncbi:SDR family NAD(P)-dependent oxidoreductase [Microlunatus parietis]|uniref:3-oxoacyl-[acyl-carrier protein] reductase n=1 Tax=Microlunatus parietis TaxID=682979 RepID=A0A7Y9I7K5_9ACTN|nr:SDR family oxidoreductase [Microlunatus parietis]NYE71705.1 3-oxoacyl-[acyl-carrier protein] reductase [Microlunatus parietis]